MPRKPVQGASSWSATRRRRAWLLRIAGLLIAAAVLTPAAATQLDIPGPANSGAFGTEVTVLPNGNIVVTDPNYLSNKGAVYLYGPTGVLISTLTGSTTGDQVGSGGVTVLSNGNYLILSEHWHNAGAADAGAATWGDGNTGVSGVVSATNSLVGKQANDLIGLVVFALSNGNYVVMSELWDNGAVVDAGAATWGNGSSGVSGEVNVANSLIGTTAGDQVGHSVMQLANGNYVVSSPNWDNVAIVDVGAVTWGNGSSGVSGAASGINSLVGKTAVDHIGSDLFGSNLVAALSNGNYVVSSPNWDNDAVADAGAVTLCNGSGGTVGEVNAANSLVGTSDSDFIGGDRPVLALSNGNYVVASPNWDNSAVADVGAVTWGNGSVVLSAVVSSSNSLIGTTAGDQVGYGVIAVGSGNYVISSPYWDNVLVLDAGAVTWANGSAAVSAVVSPVNSLIGSTAADQIGYNGANVLSNGNYVVRSPYWDNGATPDVGAVTWGNGSSGIFGVVSASNSLIGTTDSDQNDASVTELSNGNYVVNSPYWDNGATVDAGAVTWGNGGSGTIGAISLANSLIGTTDSSPQGADVTALSNGNYVVENSGWDNGTTLKVGAVTWGNGSSGTSGVISAANSLIGTMENDQVGVGGVTALSDGNYVVSSPYRDSVATLDTGAVTWANGSTGLFGTVAPANSLIGTTEGDQIGAGGVSALSKGNYVVRSVYWDNVAIVDAGALSFGSGSVGVSSTILATNSVRGTAASGGLSMVFGYDAARVQLAVGWPASNTLSLFKPDLMFVNGFE